MRRRKPEPRVSPVRARTAPICFRVTRDEFDRIHAAHAKAVETSLSVWYRTLLFSAVDNILADGYRMDPRNYYNETDPSPLVPASRLKKARVVSAEFERVRELENRRSALLDEVRDVKVQVQEELARLVLRHGERTYYLSTGEAVRIIRNRAGLVLRKIET